jgi:hypothetical protein
VRYQWGEITNEVRYQWGEIKNKVRYQWDEITNEVRYLRSFVISKPLQCHVDTDARNIIRYASSRSDSRRNCGVERDQHDLVPTHVFGPEHRASPQPSRFKPIEVSHAARTSSVRILLLRWLLGRFMLGHACRHQGRVEAAMEIAVTTSPSVQ